MRLQNKKDKIQIGKDTSLHLTGQRQRKLPQIKVYLNEITFTYGTFPGGSDGKESACSAGDMGSIPGSEKSPGEGNGYPFQDSGLENSTDKRSLAGYSPWVCRVRHDLATN